jgi:hypothetical protein
VPTEPGQEVIVGAGGSERLATELRVFGGLGNGSFRLLASVRAVRGRDAASPTLPFAVGEAVAAHAGDEIVVGDRRGRVTVLGVRDGTAEQLLRFAAFPDQPRTAATKLAVGDLIPGNPGGEIVVADDGTRGDALVRVFDGASGRLLADFNAFAAGQAPAGVELWIADVMRTAPGAELIVGQGSAGGTIRVFSLASGTPRPILDLRASVHRTTSLPRQLTVGALMPGLPGNQIAVAQSDPRLPIEVFVVRQGRSHLLDSIPMPPAEGEVESVTIGP